MTRASKAIEAAAAMVAERKARERAAREERGRRAGRKEAGTASEGGAEPLVNRFAAAQGDYVRDRRDGKSPALRNQGGTALDRWEAKGLLSTTQLAAIAHMQRLWRIVDVGPRLTANLDRTLFGCAGEGSQAEIEARADLHRIRAGFPAPYWELFENVARFDEPAGVAGSRLAGASRSAAEAARLVVCLVADTIHLRERLSY